MLQLIRRCPKYAEGYKAYCRELWDTIERENEAEDELAGHSKLLAEQLEKRHIPCRLEIGPKGGHGFADGTGTSVAGWTGRAARWYESLEECG